jgi:iron complex outermembrane receptor protein
MAAAVSILALASVETHAQTTSASNEGERKSRLEEIVVTATRQETQLQETPLAITAITAEALNQRGVQTAADIGNIVPNATFRRAQGAFGPGVTAFVRGIGSLDTSLGGEAGVAFYIDDVYYPLLLGSNFDLLDLDHVEVLRGPQGTLFGRNALAGAVNLVSKNPDPANARAYITATTGSYDRRDVRAGFNVPLGERAALSVAGLMKSREGYQEIVDFRCQMEANGTPGLAGRLPYSTLLLAKFPNNTPQGCGIGHLGGEDVKALRASMLFNATDKLKLVLTSDYIDDNSENPADSLVAVNAATAASKTTFATQAGYFGVAYDNRFVPRDPYKTYATYSDPVSAGVVIPGNAFYNGLPTHGGAAFSPRTELTNWGVSGKAIAEVTPGIDAIVIAGYREMDETHAFDTDGSPLVQEHTIANIGEKYYNIEARLAGRHDLLDWVAGVFYFHGDGFNKAVTYSPWNGFLKYQNTTYDPTSKAMFANGVVHVSDRFNITVGGRYSEEKKVVDYSNLADDNVGNLLFAVTPEEERFDWKAGVDYRLSDSVMAFASVSTGGKSPGFNPRPLQPTQVVSFPGDLSQAYELGVKADLFDDRLRLNPVLFYTDYKTRIVNTAGQEYQLGADGSRLPGRQITIPNPDVPNGTKGFELEAESEPVDGLVLSASVGYAKFKSPDLKHIDGRLRGVPEWSASASVAYEWQTASLGGSITPRVDWFYQGDFINSTVRREYDQPAYSVFNSRVTYRNDEHGFTLSVGATNLFDEQYYRNYFVYQDIGFASVNGQIAPPREWYVSVGKEF